MTLSEETKAKLSVAHKGKTHSLETCLLMLETRRGPNNPMFGKTPSKESRAKMSAAKLGALNPNFGLIQPAEITSLMRVNHPHTKPIFQYSLIK